jgi:hypothetical protein
VRLRLAVRNKNTVHQPVELRLARVLNGYLTISTTRARRARATSSPTDGTLDRDGIDNTAVSHLVHSVTHLIHSEDMYLGEI